ncbi:MAG TPA: hypothetical protein VIA61_06310 [Methylomirabilota bacterium]
MRFARRALLAAAVVWAVAADAAAQTDLAQALVGRWEGEISARFHKNNPAVVLVITSLKEDGGRWVADARFGASPVSLEIDAGGAQPSLRWSSRNGTVYAVTLLDARTLSGTATLTQEVAGNRERERPVKLEKKP